MSDLKLWRSDCEWVVATDEADATIAWETYTGEKSADYDHEWREDTRSAITISEEDGSDPVTHSAAEWAAMSGRGYLWCSEV